MKKTASILLLAAVLLLSLAGTVSAQPDLPVGTCPRGFTSEPFMEEDMEHEHFHAGLKVDLNGDGTICMKEATDTIHVHVDNFVRAR